MEWLQSLGKPHERVSGAKIIGDQLYLRVEILDPTKASGFKDNGGLKTPDYVGSLTVRDSAGIKAYMDDVVTPAEAFR